MGGYYILCSLHSNNYIGDCETNKTIIYYLELGSLYWLLFSYIRMEMKRDGTTNTKAEEIL